ncbi:MAG: hypothetical protein RBS99_06665 [Rhodospirillales bacterium]|nr:hypothetical protein [Rhodospirillales bacterium]
MRPDCRPLMIATALLALTPVSLTAAETMIALCPGKIAGGQASVAVDGSFETLLVGQTAAGCLEAKVPAERNDILWIGPAPVFLTAAQPLILVGDFRQKPVAIRSIEAVDTTVPGGPPFVSSDVPYWQARPFGVEERVEIVDEREGLNATCQPGRKPAGLLVRLPIAATAARHLRISYRSSVPLDIGLSDEGADSVPLTVLPASEAVRTVLTDAGASHLTVSCRGQGAFEIIAIGPGASGWAWAPDLWRASPDALIAEALALGVDTLYVSVPVKHDGVADAKALATFIAKASRRGIQVWAVDGDPRAILSAERDRFSARAQAYERFNAGEAPESRISGLQLDIEPYVMPGYGQATESFDRAWAATITAVATATHLPVTAAVPFWFAHPPHREWALDTAAASLAGIAVMAYRGEAAKAAAIAEPALAWGEENGVPVRVALENGLIPDEDRLIFQPAATGTLWKMPLGGRQVLVLLDRPAANPLGPAFGLAVEGRLSGDVISFQGNTLAFAAAADAVQRRFADRPSFRGLALHGILDSAVDLDLHDH